MRPLNENVLVKPDPIEETTQGGIILSEKAIEKPLIGTVISVGNKVTDIKVGERVVYGKYEGTSLEINGELHLIMTQGGILAIL